MQKPPLTHHEIIGLVEPYTRAGRHVDLAASDRIARRLAFKPAAGHTGDLQEALSLDNPGISTWRLTRTITHASGLVASVQAEGREAGPLLALVEAVPAQGQFSSGEGWLIAHHHRLEAAAGTLAARRVLMRSVARVRSLTLEVSVSRVPGVLAEIDISAPAESPLDLPDDLLAVLGLDWTRLRRVSAGWRGSLRLKNNEPERSADARNKLERTAQHLARTLAEPPARFHERHAAARWRVVARRATPLFGALALLAGAAAVGQLDLAENSVWRMLIFHAPPLLMVVFFCMREMPRIEIPPLPRPLRAHAWPQAVGPQGRAAPSPPPVGVRESGPATFP